jgi:hypothetical protein
MNVTLPLQIRHPGPPFPTLLRLAGHPQNDLKFSRSVGRSREVTRTSCCLFSFITQARHSRPFYALWATPKTALNFSRLVGRSVGRSIGWSVNQLVGHGDVTQTSCCLFSFVTWARPFRPFYALRATPKTALNFGRSVGRSRGSHTNVMLPLQFQRRSLEDICDRSKIAIGTLKRDADPRNHRYYGIILSNSV